MGQFSGGIQNLSYLAGEAFSRERLVEEMHAGLQDSMVEYGVFGVPGNV